MIVQAELLVAISRSGMTSETLWAVKAFRKQSPDGKVCAITTRTDSILAGLADIVLDASPAQEQSIGETRSFTAMLLLAQHFAAHKQEDQAFSVGVQTGPETLKAGMPAFFGLARKIAYILPVNHFFFLGVGWLYVIAYEAAFKIKEFHLVGHPDSQGNQTGQFISLADLRRKVLAFIECCNRTMAKPFKWTYLGKALAVQIVNRLCFDVLVSAFVCGLLLYTNESVH